MLYMLGITSSFNNISIYIYIAQRIRVKIYIYIYLHLQTLTSCCHHFMLLLLLFILFLVALFSLPAGSLFQLCLLIDGTCEGMFLRVQVQRILIVWVLREESRKQWNPTDIWLFLFSVYRLRDLTLLSREDDLVWMKSMFLQASRRFRTL